VEMLEHAFQGYNGTNSRMSWDFITLHASCFSLHLRLRADWQWEVVHNDGQTE
jgi:hypothetical protein